MKNLWECYKPWIGLLLIITSVVFSIWLCFWVMLYGGIMQGLENWGVNNSAVAWGIIKAVFCGLGMIPAYIGVTVGWVLLFD